MSAPHSLHTLRIVSDRSRPAAIDAADLVRRVGQLSRGYLREGLVLTWDTRGAALLVQIPRRSLEQVLLNLIFHAEARTASPGRLRLEACRIGARRPGGEASAPDEPRSYVRIRLVDSGPPLTADQRRRLFESGVTNGGPSMAIAYALVRGVGGLITVDEESDTEGTTLNVFLPLVEVDAETAANFGDRCQSPAHPADSR